MKTWQPRGRSRERILCFGVQGTGKSHAFRTIMDRVTDCTFYIIDNDNAWDRQLEGTPHEDMVREEYRGHTKSSQRGGEEVVKLTRDHDYENPEGNIVLYHCDGWEENVAAIEDAMSRAERKDWVCIDSGTQLWDDVAAYYVDQIFDSRIDKYFMQVRQERQAQREAATKKNEEPKNLAALEGWMDYGVINPMYKESVTRPTLNPPCHLFMTAELTEIGKEDRKDKELQGLFGPYHVKAKGQKRLGHNPQTVMLMTKTRAGEWYMTSVKDRGERVQVENTAVEDFARDYLYKIAGWRSREVEEV